MKQSLTSMPQALLCLHSCRMRPINPFLTVRSKHLADSKLAATQYMQPMLHLNTHSFLLNLTGVIYEMIVQAEQQSEMLLGVVL